MKEDSQLLHLVFDKKKTLIVFCCLCVAVAGASEENKGDFLHSTKILLFGLIKTIKI